MASAEEESAKQNLRRRAKRPASHELTPSTSVEGKRHVVEASEGADPAGQPDGPRGQPGEAADLDQANGASRQATSERNSMVTTPGSEPSATSADKPQGAIDEPESAPTIDASTAAACSSTPSRMDVPAGEATAIAPQRDAPMQGVVTPPQPSSVNAPTTPLNEAAAGGMAVAPALLPAAATAGLSALSFDGVAEAVQRELMRAAKQGQQPRLEDIMQALRGSAAPATAAPAGAPPAVAAAVAASAVVTAPAVPGLMAAAQFTDGVRAIGAISPATATPTPVVQQQGVPTSAASTPADTPADSKPRNVHAADDDSNMLDAAEVLMSLVKQPGLEATDQSCTVDTATDPMAAGADVGVASPPESPHDAASDGTAAAVAVAAMGTEVDGNGRRSSRRRRQPNSRIMDELEPSEREKAWGKGRGRRKNPADKPPLDRRARVPLQLPTHSRTGSATRSRRGGSPGEAEAEGAQDGQEKASGKEGILTLEALRQMRERNIPIVGLELLVSADGKWLAAKVAKVDHDFKKVVIKYMLSGQVATLNWHKEDTKSRVALSRSAVESITEVVNRSQQAAASQAAATPDGRQASMAAALPASAMLGLGIPAFAAQQQANTLEMQRRMHQLLQLQHHMAIQQAVAAHQQQRNTGAMSMLPHLQMPLLNAHLAQQQQQQQEQAAAAAAAVQPAASGAQPPSPVMAGAGAHMLYPAIAQHILQQLQENGGVANPQQAALLAQIAAGGMAGAAVAQAPATPPPGASLGGAGPVRLDAEMFPKLLGHLQPGQHKIVCRLTRDNDVRTVALVGVDSAVNGIVAEYMDQGPPGRLVVTQADLQNELFRIEALKVIEVREGGTPSAGQNTGAQ